MKAQSRRNNVYSHGVRGKPVVISNSELIQKRSLRQFSNNKPNTWFFKDKKQPTVAWSLLITINQLCSKQGGGASIENMAPTLTFLFRPLTPPCAHERYKHLFDNLNLLLHYSSSQWPLSRSCHLLGTKFPLLSSCHRQKSPLRRSSSYVLNYDCIQSCFLLEYPLRDMWHMKYRHGILTQGQVTLEI